MVLWRVHISPFACKLLDDVSVLPFFQLTLYLPNNTRDRSNIKQIIAVFSLVVIYQKSPSENAGDYISKTLIFKNFLEGNMLPDPPIFSSLAYILKKSQAMPLEWYGCHRVTLSITAQEVASARSCSKFS